MGIRGPFLVVLCFGLFSLLKHCPITNLQSILGFAYMVLCVESSVWRHTQIHSPVWICPPPPPNIILCVSTSGLKAVTLPGLLCFSKRGSSLPSLWPRMQRHRTHRYSRYWNYIPTTLEKKKVSEDSEGTATSLWLLLELILFHLFWLLFGGQWFGAQGQT